MNKERPELLSIGPSGVGKGTLCALLCSTAVGIYQLTVSHTTRKKRPEEIHGIHYVFVTRHEFKKRIDQGGYIEHAEVHGEMYGTPFAEIERIREVGRIPVLEIDTQGALQLVDTLTEAVFVFVKPPSLEMPEERLRGRGTEVEEKILKRLDNAREEIEIAHAAAFDHVTNGNIFQTVAEIDEIYRRATS
jgi:guanylate kinase